MEFLKTYSSFIGGKFIDPEQGKIRKDCNPSNGELLAELSFSDASVLDTVVTPQEPLMEAGGNPQNFSEPGFLIKWQM